MAETGNEDGGPNDGRNRASHGPSPSHSSTDPEWVTDDFSSLDLGEDSVDTSARPVRRLDLPPLVQAGDDGTEYPGAVRPNDLGVFASVPDDENLTISSSAGDRLPLQPVREDGAPTAVYEQPPGAPKQGVPPHPLAGGRGPAAGPIRGDDDLYRVADAPGSRAVSGGHDDFTTVYEDDANGFGDRFNGPDRRQAGPAGGPRPGAPGGPGPRQAGRAQLELAPAPPVQQDRSRWMIPAAAILGVLALVAGYLVFLRSNSDDSGTFVAEAEDPAADLVEDDLEADPAADPATDPSAPSVLSDSPVLTLEGATDGPLEVETKYEMTIDGVPNGSQYLVVVDDIPQEPALDYLPVLILPEGRHTISVVVTSGAQSASTNPVDVYVLAPELTATYRANLSSVSVSEQGWIEALKQFDDFRAAGHENLMLSPSDPYPSLLPGFWNLYVGGFADAEAAIAYCTDFGLSIPDQCFPAPFDPDGPPRDG